MQFYFLIIIFILLIIFYLINKYIPILYNNINNITDNYIENFISNKEIEN
jgi:hypothetical protein